jgi:Peptidase family M28
MPQPVGPVRPAAVFLACVTAAACAPAPARPPAPSGSAIDTLALRAHTYFLSSDLLLGRATGSPGAAFAALYIEAQCRGLGLEPVAGSYAHTVPLESAEPRADSSWLDIAGRRLVPSEDFLITSGVRATLHGFRGQPVYVGTADDIRQHPESLPALDGMIAVVGGTVRTDAADLLAERGAAGMIQVVDDSAAFALYVASRGKRLTLIDEPDVPSSFFPSLPAVLAGPGAVPSLRAALRAHSSVELAAAFVQRRLPAENVACLLPGTDASRRDTAIALTAHFDHLGVSVPDASGDSIYNGFSDNAAGVAMLLALAKAIREGPGGALRHGVLLLFFTGEEAGLLGSDYFVARPAFPLERIRAVINLDAGAPPARPWTWRLAGGTNNPLGDLGVDVAAARGWSATTSEATANSDYFPFARRGVPAIFIVPGPAPYEGLSADSSQALRRRWDRYHQPGDAFYEDFPFIGLQRYAEYAYRIVLAVDRGETRRP